MLKKQLIVLLRWKSGDATTSLRTASAVKTEINTDIEQHRNNSRGVTKQCADARRPVDGVEPGKVRVEEQFEDEYNNNCDLQYALHNIEQAILFEWWIQSPEDLEGHDGED